MRPVRGGVELVGGSAGAHGHPRLWRTPTPYLFLGFAAMMALIAVALLVLICTRRKPSSGSSSRRGSATESSSSAAAAARALVPLDREPKVVVIMAGDNAPSFLAWAKPHAFAVVAGAAAEPAKVDAA